MSDAKTTLVTPTGRIVFHKSLFSADDNGKHKASLVFDKAQDLKRVKELLMEAAKSKYKDEVVQSKKFKRGLKAPDEDAIAKYDFFTEDSLILEAGTKFDVDVKGPKKGPDGKYEDLIEDDIKAGDYCRFLISAYAWEYETSKGASFNLTAVQKIKDGEAFYSRVASDTSFDEQEFDVEAEETINTSETIEGQEAFEDAW